MKPITVRTLAKLGMAGSMAVLVLPQLHPDRGRCHGRNTGVDLHVWAGVALIGFAVWHYNCYQPPVWTKED
ncbi:MAG: hypothetical protein V1792_13065 [Pseudomonadota bacterium]